ncbi:molecular chaperone DnaK (HSP70) [Azospirillum brasilense]|uniref:Molecular chaperone DnaK (HSP70) n=1 Tax=Azospirillum brasilense TaxID=192 RepID=A0A560CK06_AZOBR|nr:Hsp70 family protein [Azospirillum brasilense]TWA85146.1 molecular chaperone DnaK (HSP70) [Azospirillum brasilense]
MAQVFGLDFGTTNSLAAIVLNDSVSVLTDRETDRPHPSAVWYHGAEVVAGRRAKDQLTEIATGVVGDVVRSPKSYLGTGAAIHVGGVAREPSDVVADILRHVRTDATSLPGMRDMGFDRAIVTIPVNMKGAARRELRDAAYKAGLHIVQYVHEPLAALYGHLRSQPSFKQKLAELEGRYVLVFDWGGGTLDLTLVKLVGGTLVQIQNMGDNTIGGDRFDERLVNHVKDRHANVYRLASWPSQMPNAEAQLIGQCELAKIRLSERHSATVFMANFLRSDGPERTLDLAVGREELEGLTRDLVDQGMANIDRLLASANVPEAAVALCLATGGVVQMPAIRNRLTEKFGLARVPTIGNGDRVIAEGAAWIAHDGLRLCLAKPFEVLHADDTYVPVIPEGTFLPLENQTHPYELGLYCVDPRDGLAKLQFTRPQWPGRCQPADPRHVYTSLALGVDATARPLFERLELSVKVDHDLIVTARARSTLRGDERAVEIHDLEFGLAADQTRTNGARTQDRDSGSPRPRGSGGAVRLRSNIARTQDAWDLVPGEIVERYRSSYLDKRLSPPQRQVEESMYYKPCSMCGKSTYEINSQGCARCRQPSPEEAAAAREALNAAIARSGGPAPLA